MTNFYAIKNYLISFLLCITILPAYSQEKQLYQLDSTFKFRAETPVNIDKVYKLDDGNYILTGGFHYYDGLTTTNMLRIDKTGKEDPSFQSEIFYHAFISKIIEQPDKKLLVTRSVFSGGIGYELNRLNADGSFDKTFAYLNFTGSIHTAALQKDGKIIIGGDFELLNSPKYKNIARLNTDGTVDQSFDVGAGPDAAVSAIKLIGETILVSGSFNSFNNINQSSKLVLLNNNGEVIKTYFQSNYICSSCSISSMDTDTEGNIYFLVPGNTGANGQTYFYGIGKIQANGSLDSSFLNPYDSSKSSPYILYSSNYIQVICYKGKLLLAGSISYSNSSSSTALVRLQPDGRRDNTLKEIRGSSNDIAISDNSFILSGDLLLPGEFRHRKIIMIDENANLIDSFKPNIKTSARIAQVIVQQDKNIYLAGDFHYLNDSLTTSLTKLSVDGIIDKKFTPRADIGPFGKIISTPESGLYFSEGSRIFKLKNNGDFDSEFGNINVLAYVGAFALCPDGKFIVTQIKDDIHKIVRLNADKTLDSSFESGQGVEKYAGIYDIQVQEDGKVLVGGNLKTYNGRTVGSIFRLNQDGSIDDSFITGNSIATIFPGEPYISSIEIEPSGGILAAGYFDSYNGVKCDLPIIRLNNDGSVKSTITAQDINFSMVDDVAFVPADSSLVVTGQFINSKEETIKYFQAAKLKIYTPPVISITPDQEIASVYPNPATSYINISIEGLIGSKTIVRIIGSYGTLVYEHQFFHEEELATIEVPIDSFAPGIYFIEVVNNGQRSVNRLIKL